MTDFDVIRSMDWLARYHANLDCYSKVVTFQIPGESEFQFIGTQNFSPPIIVTAMCTHRLMRKGCGGYLAHVHEA